MKLRAGNFAVEALPDGDGDIFRSGIGSLELGHFEIEMPMIVDADHFALEDVLQVFEIDDEAGDGINLAGDGDFEGVVVAVSVAVGAFAKGAAILVLRPGVVPVIVGGGEFGFAGEQDHTVQLDTLMIDEAGRARGSAVVARIVAALPCNSFCYRVTEPAPVEQSGKERQGDGRDQAVGKGKIGLRDAAIVAPEIA